MMKLFDFDRHYERIKCATTPEEIAEIQREYDVHFDSLTKQEQEIFVLRLREHAREEVIRTKALIGFIKEIMAGQSETA